LLILVLLTPACGGAPPRESSLAYAELQQAEARLERAATRVDTCEAEAVDEAGAASESACTLATELADADARTRCARTQSRAAALRAHFDATCTATEGASE
jgi:phage shock protein A